ncbi:DUF1669 domain-containing protein [Pedobacter sp. G11]|nr:DUF1669 domain-containing protein [Pedobacter sp. G11]
MHMNNILTNGTEIKQRIIAEIQNARQCIYLAMAWFTDRDIATSIIDAKNRNVAVDVILSSNASNETVKLMFKGANISVHAFDTGDDRGMMHHKFCLIDHKISINGSYNYSYNASNNNVENIQVSDDPITYKQFLIEFERIRYNIDHNIDVNTATEIATNNNPRINYNREVVDQTLDVKSEYEKVLDSMIASEVSSFDRDNLRKQGFDRSHSNNGDHNVLDKALDTLYNGFINDIDVIEDKKRRLISKIVEQRAKSISQLKERCDIQISTIENEFEVSKDNLNNKIINLKSEVSINQSVIGDLKENRLFALNKKINEIENRIRESVNAFVKPGIKWFELITTIIFTIALFIYLQIFYSSAAYILLYSEEDAKIALKTSSETVTPQIFNPEAFSNSWIHGTMAFVFVCLFVFIPLIFACLERIMTNKLWAKILTYGLGLVLVDSFIAIKIAQSIHEIKSQTEISPEKWSWIKIFTDTNFYLVFILGAFGILLFKFCFEKLNRIADARNPDVAEQQNKLFIQDQRNDINKIEIEIGQLKSEIELKSQENIAKNSQIKLHEADLENLPLKKVGSIENRKNDLNNKLQIIEITTDIYKSHVENDNLSVSIDALRDRINIFLEGWNDFLHKEYSISKASEKSALATEIAILWEHNKVNRNSVDARVKIK